MEKVIKKIGYFDVRNEDVFLVNWTLGNICNFACSYCDEILNDGSTKWCSTEKVLNFCDKIIGYYQNVLGKKILFQFTGGEVTLNKDLITILDHLKSKGCKVGIISNGSRVKDFWEEISKRIDYITLSFHPERKYSSNYYDVVQFLHKKVHLQCSIMMHPAFFDEAKNFGLKIINNFEGVIVFFEALMKNLYSNHTLLSDYSKEQMNQLEELYLFVKYNINMADEYSRNLMIQSSSKDGDDIMSAGEFIIKKKNRWKGWLCWAGVDQLVVAANGDVFRGWCVQNWVGNIDNESLCFPKYPVFCTRDNCHCACDIRLRRHEFSLINNQS